MSSGIHLAVDAMGGDQGPRFSVPASLAFLQQFPDSHITLTGDRALILRELKGHEQARLNIVHTPEVVTAGDKPSYALRHKRNSSLWQCLALVAGGCSDAAVSAGNTGALMAMAKHVIGTYTALDRPAICKPVPTQKGVSYLLDLGANLECTAEQLVQFAVMGVALARASGLNSPTVGLLNVGIEDVKGKPQIQAAARQLRQINDLQYVGFVEADQIFSGSADVIVCDGFAGNIALKASEGAARFLFASLREHLQSGALSRLGAAMARPQLRTWRDRFNPSAYNGAALLGLRKVVIKSHGGADVGGFCQALVAAREQVSAALAEKVGSQLAMAGNP